MLTSGLITRINAGASDATGNLQLTYHKPLPGHNDRFRLGLSDGEHHIVGMLATQHSKVLHTRSPSPPTASPPPWPLPSLTGTLPQLVTEGEIVANSIVELKKYVSNEANGKMMLIVLDLSFFPRTPPPPLTSNVTHH